MDAGAEAGAEAAADGVSVFSDDDAWDVIEEIPNDSAAALILLEHHWAVPLRDAIARAGGFRISDGFISPLDLVEIGLLSSEEAKELHAVETSQERNAGGGTRTPDTRIMILRIFSSATGNSIREGHKGGHKRHARRSDPRGSSRSPSSAVDARWRTKRERSVTRIGRTTACTELKLAAVVESVPWRPRRRGHSVSRKVLTT